MYSEVIMSEQDIKEIKDSLEDIKIILNGRDGQMGMVGKVHVMWGMSSWIATVIVAQTISIIGLVLKIIWT